MEENENRIALVGIIVYDPASVASVNETLHEYAGYIIGRLGIPVRERGINAISIVMDAPNNAVNALTGKLGAISGVTAKALFQKAQIIN